MRCYYCGKDHETSVIYCTECGKQIRGEKIDYSDRNKKYFVQTLSLFLCILLVIIASIATVQSFLEHELIFGGLLIFITIAFALLDLRSFLKLFRFSLHLKPVILIIIGAPLFALFVNYLAESINHLFNKETSFYFTGYQLFTSNMYLYGIVFVAIIPGIFEELLFRGLLFNHLLRLTTPKTTIIITSILFAFIHFSFLSILWLGLIGLFLGYLRLRYRTVIYGMMFHILYNASIFYFEILLNN